MKKFISLSLCVILCLTFCFPRVKASAAYNISASDEAYLHTLQASLENMSVQELNAYIHEAVMTLRSGASAKILIEPVIAKGAWLAFAQVLKVSGYPCMGTLIECSVYNDNYSETDGVFAGKIRTSAEFTDWLMTQKNGIVFEIDTDLQLSLHKVDAVLYGNSQGARVFITDTFDFEFMMETDEYKSIAISLGNDIAYLSQIAGILSVIAVNITISM